MSIEIKIETGIPIPVGWSRSRFPLAQLQVGQSFFVPEGDDKLARKISIKVANFSYTHAGYKFVTRRIAATGDSPAGVRVWRIECPPSKEGGTP